MTSSEIETYQCKNGLHVIVQRMPYVQSAALTLMTPAGAAYDAPGRSGTAAVLNEMFSRGTQRQTPREFSAALDNLGLQRSVGVGIGYITFSAAATADRLEQAIPLLAEQIRTPRLTDEEFGPARELVLQTLSAQEDEPQQKLGHQLRRCSYPAPWGNPPEGTFSEVPQITLQDVLTHYQQRVGPNGAAIGIAGNVDPDRVFAAVEKSLNDWSAIARTEPECGDSDPSPFHISQPSSQTHIGLAWETVPYPHERYYEAWAAVSVLSGGMSSRLFTEVREKRGLCYSVSASINSQKDRARVFGYSGTLPDRAQETLEVMVSVIRSLHVGITDDELARCRTRAKTSLIMQQESTMSRSGSLARDQLFLGRVRRLEEVQAAIDALTVDRIRQFALDYYPASMTLVTLGPQPLDASCLTDSTVAV